MNYFKNIVKKYSKTVGKRTQIDDVTSGALIYQRLFGQQVLDPNWTWRKFYLRHLIMLSIYIYVFFGTLESLRTAKDAELIAEACYTLIMLIVFPIKLFLFINNRFLFRKLYLMAKNTLTDEIKTNSDMKNAMGSAKKIIYVLFSMVIIPGANYELITLFNYVRGQLTTLSRTTATLVPMTSPYFELAWFIHTIFLLHLSTTIILDMWLVLLIYFLCSASESLRKNLEVRKLMDETSEAFGIRLNEMLKKFYKSHVKHVEYLNTMNRMYKWLAFVPLCNAAMCFCIILLVISKEANWRFAAFVMPMFAEILAYNWFGEQIKTKAADLKASLINFDWTSLSQKDRMNYFVIMSYTMKKEFGIKTATGTDLSLITMSAVLKASYQAFTVLQSVGD